MGKLQTKLVVAIANATDSYKTCKKQLILSVISLFLATAILISVVYCWFVMGTATVDTSYMELNAGNGIRISGIDKDGIVHIRDAYDLIPASSVDGRSLYFVGDGTFSKKTEEMTFRTANYGDKNVHYIQVDLSITAEADHTAIYIDPNSTSITLDGSAKKAAPLRAAIWYDGLSEPIVFNPYKKSTVDAVSEADRATGYLIKTAEQTSVEFSEYSYDNNKSIVRLNSGETKDLSVIIWLEGSDPACTNDIIGKKISVNLSFATPWDETETIEFRDNSDWLTAAMNEDDSSIVLNYEYEGVMSQFPMYKNGNSWYCKVPKNAANDITFTRVSSDGNEISIWEHDINNKSTKNRKSYTVYVVDENSTEVNNFGYWLDKSGDGVGSDNGGGELGNDW